MKKVILSVLFLVFASNLSSNNREKEYLFNDCYSFANIAQWTAQQSGYTFDESVGIYLAAYSTCWEYNMAHLEEIEEEEFIDPNDDPR